MAFKYDLGFVSTAGNEFVFRWKQLLIAQGWTIPSSSDGTTWGAGDFITQPSLGAGGLNNVRAWFIAQSPLPHTRSICIQSSDSGGTAYGQVRSKYSPVNTFNLGSPSATQTPSASDEIIFMGGGTDANPTFATTYNFLLNGEGKSYIIVGDADEDYGFWLMQVKFGNTYPTKAIVLDTMKSGSFYSYDKDPAILYASLDPNVQTFGYHFLNGSSVFSYGFFSGSMQRFVPSTIAGFPAGYSPNEFLNKDPFFPIPYLRNPSLTGLPYGWKGLSSITQWQGFTRANFDTLSYETANDRICIQYVVLPWSGTFT